MPWFDSSWCLRVTSGGDGLNGILFLFAEVGASSVSDLSNLTATLIYSANASAGTRLGLFVQQSAIIVGLV